MQLSGLGAFTRTHFDFISIIDMRPNIFNFYLDVFVEKQPWKIEQKQIQSTQTGQL